MLKRISLIAFMVMLAAMPAFAQKAEVGVTFGWSLNDGVSGGDQRIPIGCVSNCLGVFNRLDPKDAFAWAIDLGFFVSPNAEVGFMYSQSPSTLQAGGTSTLDIGNMLIQNYHGTFTYNFGATDYTRQNGAPGTIPGVSRFSTTWGAGVKLYGASKVGARVGVRVTPAYIKSDPAGYWCDPYWGCYLVGDAQYANQFEFGGGITFRF